MRLRDFYSARIARLATRTAMSRSQAEQRGGAWMGKALILAEAQRARAVDEAADDAAFCERSQTSAHVDVVPEERAPEVSAPTMAEAMERERRDPPDEDYQQGAS